MQRILVFGATSAIAAQACRRWATQGARLHLVGRSANKLQGVVVACNAAERVTSAVADFQDSAGAEALVESSLAALEGPADVVLIAHGDLGDQLRSEASFVESARIFEVNLISAVALIVPLATALEAQGAGALAVITSVAGERGRPRNYTYGAAKGGLSIYLQGVRSRLVAAGVQVTTLKLGPVDTPMTVGHRKNPLFVGPKRAARDLVHAIERGAHEAFIPWYWRPILAVVRVMPEAIFQRLGFLSGR